ncbi:MAG: FAD-dependent oxidoreductase [Planctomycetota bacterium]
MKVDPRFLAEDGREIFTGNELLLKGCLEVEGGVHLLGGYPGSPIAGFFDSIFQIQDLLKARGVRAVINNNEALAAAMLNGSQVAGVRGLICIKSVGVHVAADALALGGLAGAHREGGAVVVYGDDPWSDSTQVPADSRYISKHLFIPVIEPSDPQEVKDYVNLAFKLSADAEVYAGFILPNNLADGGGSVECRPNQFPALNVYQRKPLDTATIDLNKFVLLPPKTWWQEANFAERFARAVAAARRLGLNRLETPSDRRRAPVGVVTSGLAYGYLRQALSDMGLDGRLPILKYGLTYPLDAEMLIDLTRRCERIVVVEERRGFLEEQASEALTAARQQGRLDAPVELWGKHMPEGLPGFPTIRGLHPSLVIGVLAPLLKRIGSPAPAVEVDTLDREIQTIAATADADVAPLPARVPTFCPGCPHRDSASLCLEIKKAFTDEAYMQRVHARGPVDLMFHGDTGCYTMLMFPPNTPLMHDYSGMGLGAGTGSGADPFITNKQVVFMGDSTFFHSGQLAIGQAIKLGQDITFIILDNRTTAMTGHQPTPGVDWDVVGETTPTQDIRDVVNGIAGDNDLLIARVDPADRAAYRSTLETTILAEGVKVLIADKECGITRTRRQRRAEREEIREKGFVAAVERMTINPEVCRFCLACSEVTGCPGLKHVPTDYGPRMDTDLTHCVNDGACARVGACWSFERLTIKRKAPPRSRVPELGLDDIPEPHQRPHGPTWHACLAGVGGMGIGLATQILVRAGHKEGYHVAFLDKKGLAIRNGGVNSQVVFTTERQPTTGLIPFGKADLILGVDALEAARALDPTGRTRVASAERTAAVINTHKAQTISGIMGRDDFDVDALERIIRRHTRADDYLARDISRICETYLGNKIYANIMMLGFAFQTGLIPVSMHSIAWAIKDTIKADHKKNLYAFNMGRKLMEDPGLFQGAPVRTGWTETLNERCRWTIRRYLRGKAKAAELRALAESTVAAAGGLTDEDKRDLVVRLYDCMRRGGIRYARRYADHVIQAYRAEPPDSGYAATRAVLHTLAGAMLIKDAVFIAELKTSPEKYARDRRKYNVNPANGDRITYRHLIPVTFRLGRHDVSFPLTARDWMFKLLKRMTILRRLPGWQRAARAYLAEYEKRLEALAPAPLDKDYPRAVALLSSPRCMDCTNPTCAELGCPLGSRIPVWVDLAYRRRWAEASEALHATNNFPEFTASICPAPCQQACKHRLQTYPVQIRQIEREIIEHAFAGGHVRPRPPESKTGKRVAVVGSGPAGLTVAQQLARDGHEVTVYEKDDAPGGLMRWGIPDHRLPKDLIDRRLEQLTAEGVTVRTGVEIGADVPAGELREHYDAVCLATGAAAAKDLPLPGRGRPGIHFALDYLRQENDRAAGRAVAAETAIHAKGKTVVVLGGGETGNDCAETALAQGAREVHQWEILPPTAVTADPTHPPVDGVRRRWSVATRQFDADSGNGRIRLTARQVRWTHSAAGPRMTETGEQVEQTADLVLLALGFDTPVPASLAEGLALATDDDGRLLGRDGATSAPDVFAAGDLATGSRLIVDAIAGGRKAAEKIDDYLNERL